MGDGDRRFEGRPPNQVVMRKPLVRPVGCGGLDREMLDARPGRPLRERVLDARHGLDLAFDLRLDPAVGPVAHEAGDALADGGVLRRSSGSRRPGRGR